MKIVIGIGLGILLGAVGAHLAALPSVDAHPTAAPAGGDELHLGIGGFTDNRNDACWVLEKKDGQRRLSLYRIISGGNTGRFAIQFEGVRQIDWEMQMMNLDSTPKPEEIKKALEKAKKNGN